MSAAEIKFATENYCNNTYLVVIAFFQNFIKPFKLFLILIYFRASKRKTYLCSENALLLPYYCLDYTSSHSMNHTV